MTSTVSARSLFVVVGKAVITISAIAIIASQIDFGFLASHRHKIGATTLAVSLVVIAAQTSFIAGLRLKLVLKALGQDRPLLETVQVALSGFFFEQVAFGFVGGDAMRLWLLHQKDVPWRTAIEAIVIDRCLGLLGLFLLALVGLPGLMALLTGYDWQVFVIAGLAAFAIAGGLAAFLFIRFAKRTDALFLVRIRDQVSALIRSPDIRTCLLMVFVLATATHCMNVLVFLLLGRDLGISLGLWHWFLIVPPALLISMLPISAGGWGLREASFVVGLASFGVRPEEAVLPPIIFGLGVLAVTLPGGIIWLANRKIAARKSSESSIAAREAPMSESDAAAAISSPSEIERARSYRRQLMRLS